MLQNPCKTLGFKKNMVYKIPPGGGGKPYPASGLNRSAPVRELLSNNSLFVGLDPVVRSSIKFNHGLSVNQSFKS